MEPTCPGGSHDICPPDELGEFIKVQLVKWTQMIKDAAIQPE
jgi:hypothetical protein